MMALKLSFTTRSINRAQWRALYRQLRIVNRETLLAWEDIFIFGTGYLQTGPDVPDFIRRVHPAYVEIPLMGSGR